ncbi:Uncharacterized protein QTN25_008866 [Entamoeba marina]
MIITLYLITFICITNAEEKSFNDILDRLKEDNYKVSSTENSAIAVAFYDTSAADFNVNTSSPITGKTFIIPTDQMSKLKFTNFYDIYKDTPEMSIAIRVTVNYIQSDLQTVYDNKDQVKYVSLKAVLEEQRMSELEWDEDCSQCESDECFDGFCKFNTDDFGGQTCATALESNPEACGLIMYIAWEGQAKGSYLKSYSNLPSNFHKYSIRGQFLDTASDFESNWLSF